LGIPIPTRRKASAKVIEATWHCFLRTQIAKKKNKKGGYARSAKVRGDKKKATTTTEEDGNHLAPAIEKKKSRLRSSAKFGAVR